MADREALAEEIARLQQMVEFYEALVKEKKTELREQLGKVGDYEAGNFIVKIQPNTRFNAAKAKAILTAEEFDKISEPVAVGKKAKEVFPEKYEDMLNTFDHKVSVQPSNKED